MYTKKTDALYICATNAPPKDRSANFLILIQAYSRYNPMCILISD
jgi:hypothetical protein